MTLTTLRSRLRGTFVHNLVRQFRSRLYYHLSQSGQLIAPPYEVKRLTILLYAKLYHVTTLVETGTNLGNTVDALKDHFNKIYSIELQPDLFKKAKEKFRDYSHISIVHGDSAKILPEVLKETKASCLFWLDGHYSSGNTAKGALTTPIIDELNHILADGRRDDVILIDDARLFTGHDDYPTLDQVRRLILDKRPDYFFDVRHDIIRAHRITEPEAAYSESPTPGIY